MVSHVSKKVDRESRAEEVRARGPRILIVDDNSVNRFILQMAFLGLGARADQANDGRQGWSSIRRAEGKGKPYDLVFLDCEMPKMSGFELARQIRRGGTLDRRGNRLWIVGMSASPEIGFATRCFDSGMDEFIPKPIDAGILEENLLAWMDPRKEVHRVRASGR